MKPSLVAAFLCTAFSLNADEPCATSYAGCAAKVLSPKPDCVLAGSPEDIANKVKRSRLLASKPSPALSVGDLERLQIATDKAHHHPQGLAVTTREPYYGRAFKVAHVPPSTSPPDKVPSLYIGEGLEVTLEGYIVGPVRTSLHDSENCNMLGRENNNLRLNIADLPGDSDFESVLTLIAPKPPEEKPCRETPQNDHCVDRNPEWYRALERAGLKVRVTGQLFYDNKHRVNSDPDNDLPGEPRRLSLWEIHPVTGFKVCKKKKGDLCSENNWREIWKVAPYLPDR